MDFDLRTRAADPCHNRDLGGPDRYALTLQQGLSALSSWDLLEEVLTSLRPSCHTSPLFDSQLERGVLAGSSKADAKRGCDCCSQIAAEDRPCATHLILDSAGHLLGCFGRAATPGARAAEGTSAKARRYNVHLPRQRLRTLLAARLTESARSRIFWKVSALVRAVRSLLHDTCTLLLAPRSACRSPQPSHHWA